MAHRLAAVTEKIRVGSQGRNLEQEHKGERLPTVFLSTACSPCPEGALHTEAGLSHINQENVLQTCLQVSLI